MSVLAAVLGTLVAVAATVRVPADVPSVEAAVEVARHGDQIVVEAGVPPSLAVIDVARDLTFTMAADVGWIPQLRIRGRSTFREFHLRCVPGAPVPTVDVSGALTVEASSITGCGHALHVDRGGEVVASALEISALTPDDRGLVTVDGGARLAIDGLRVTSAGAASGGCSGCGALVDADGDVDLRALSLVGMFEDRPWLRLGGASYVEDVVVETLRATLVSTTGGAHVVRRARIDAAEATVLDARGGEVTVDRARVRDASVAVAIAGPDVDRLDVVGGDLCGIRAPAAIVSEASLLTVRATGFAWLSGLAIDTLGARTEVENVDVLHGDDGAVRVGGAGRVVVRNALFGWLHNPAVALAAGASPWLSQSYNAVYVATLADPAHGWGAPAVEDDPRLRVPNAACAALDVGRSASSPLIDAGDPAVIDVDGTRSDIGVSGGPWAVPVDRDADGYTGDVDCDDSDATVHPGARDTPYDGADQDCDGADLIDADGDGWVGVAAGGEDCDDTNQFTHPGALDRPSDRIDQDCDGADLAGPTDDVPISPDPVAPDVPRSAGCQTAHAAPGRGLWVGWVLAAVLRFVCERIAHRHMRHN